MTLSNIKQTKCKAVKPSVIDQLKLISKNFEDLENYSMDVDGDDPTDAIFYSKLKDKVTEKIKEIEN